MKKALYLTGIAAMGLLMSSCSLDNENPSAMEGEVIVSTPVLANTVVMGIHQSFGETNSYRGRYIPYFGVNSDCEIFNNYAGVADPKTDKEASLAVYSADVSNTYMNTANNAWAKLYEGVERANMAIADMEKAADLTNSEMRQLYGELLTLRAFIYYDLVKAWGDVPYRFEPVTSATIYKSQESRVVVLQKILEDLKVAEDYVALPNANSYTKSTERVSLTFVRGLRARVALLLAGKSVQTNGNVEYNIEDAAARKELMQIAYDECVAAISQHPSKLENLDLYQNWKNICNDVTTAGLESIYEIPFSDGRGRVLYTWGGKHAAKDQWTGLAAGGKNGPIQTLWFDYDPNDARRDLTVVPFTWVADAEVQGLSVKSVQNLSSSGWSFGKLRFEWMKRFVTSSNDDGINWQVMRLADVYMMAAEAANELDDLGEAKKYIKPVMVRAYGEDLANRKLSVATNKESFFNLLVDERKFEFAGEALRKVDLMRWGILSQKMNEAKQNLIALANREPGGDIAENKYNAYPLKFYYNVGLDADAYDADAYYIYGMNAGDTDDEGKALKKTNSTYVFTLKCDKAADQEKVNSYLNNYFVNDPDSKMFWPIWKVFIDSSNGQLRNYYGY